MGLSLGFLIGLNKGGIVMDSTEKVILMDQYREKLIEDYSDYLDDMTLEELKMIINSNYFTLRKAKREE